jgi:restriction system protein
VPNDIVIALPAFTCAGRDQPTLRRTADIAERTGDAESSAENFKSYCRATWGCATVASNIVILAEDEGAMKKPSLRDSRGFPTRESDLMKFEQAPWVAPIWEAVQELGKSGDIDSSGQAEIKASLRAWDRAVRKAMEKIEPANQVPLSVSGILIPAKKTVEGLLLRSTSVIWTEVVSRLSKNWDAAYQITSEKWEEIVAGAFHKAGYDDVVLTPRSGDYGRDVIAVRHGVGCIKIIGSVKAYRADRLVRHDDVRALLGVLNAERDASKAFFATTADFAPRIKSDPFIRPFLPTRLELMNGKELRKWLGGLLKK